MFRRVNTRYGAIKKICSKHNLYSIATEFPSLWTWNNLGLIDLPLKSIKLKKIKNEQFKIVLLYFYVPDIFFVVEWYYLPIPPLGQDMTQGQFLSGV